ncbi:hypothetical protein ACFCYI_04200 [Streptomyces sp. NPDC056257]|uniref:hypothetical protein n=1 Tax=Streptomyces sp. NPDC056257 TaxID=3345765 RepID=UPI0035DFA0C9
MAWAMWRPATQSLLADVWWPWSKRCHATGLGEGRGQYVKALAGGTVVSAVGDEVGNGVQVCVQQAGDVLALFCGQAVQFSAGLLEQCDRVLADEFVSFLSCGERGPSSGGPGRGQRGEGDAGDGEDGASFQAFHGGVEGLSQGGDGAERSERDDASGACGQPVRPPGRVDQGGGQAQRFRDVDLRFGFWGDPHDFPLPDPVLVGARAQVAALCRRADEVRQVDPCQTLYRALVGQRMSVVGHQISQALRVSG